MGRVARRLAAIGSRASGRTVAGRDAECFEVSGPDGSGVLCIDTRLNVVVLAEGTFDSEFSRLEATRVEDQPDERAFEPPFPVIDPTELEDGAD